MIKRTCNGCKAQWIDINTMKPFCYLNYSSIEDVYGKLRPLVRCPKPKTQPSLQNIIQTGLDV